MRGTRITGPLSSPVPNARGLRADVGAEVAIEMGDSYIGVEHAFLAMLRTPQGIPARALAGLADLADLEAAVLAAKNAPASGPPEHAVFLPEGQVLTAPLSGHQVMINGHALRPPLSFVVGRSGRLGAGLRGGGLQRSEDERPGRPAVSGTAGDGHHGHGCAERRGTAAPDPPDCEQTPWPWPGW